MTDRKDGKAARLTSVQQAALDFLRSDFGWHSSYGTKFSRQTYQALVSRGLAESKGAGQLGSMFSPAITIKFRALSEARGEGE